MIKSITIANYLGESITLELGFPERSGFLVQSIDGLGPSKAGINTTELAATDGAVFNSARANSRNIVMNLRFLFKPTVEDVRQLSYKYFPIKKRLRFTIETDNRSSQTYGYVESNEPDIFSDQEGTQISIICPDSYFYSTAKTITIFSGMEALFEFPFSNDSLTEDLLDFGGYKQETTGTVIYSGDAETGMLITIHAVGPASNIAIFNETTRETMRISTDKLAQITGAGFGVGDDIIISTVKGNKYIALLRNGAYTNIINCLDKDADWFQLAKGENTFTYSAESGVLNLEFTVENQTLYEGV